MACIKKKRGKWTIDYRDVTGRRRWETVQGTRKDAEDRLAKIIGSGYKVVDSKRTFEDYAKEWMEIYAKAHVKASTQWEYDSVLRNHLLPAFGSVPFSKINREMAKKLVAEKVQKGLSRSHVRNIVVPLREMFNHAIDDVMLVSNTASRLGRFNYRRGESKKIEPLTKDELTTLLQTTREKMPYHYPLILPILGTSLGTFRSR